MTKVKHFKNEVKTTLEPQPNSFSLLLHSIPSSTNSKNKTTRFKNTLKRPIFLKGDYEVALEKIFFSNINNTDLGYVEITYIHENHERSSYVTPIMLSCKMGITYTELFRLINFEIENYLKDREYRERLNIRRKFNLPLNNNLIKIGDDDISLPVKENPIYDYDVYQEITEMCPKIVYDDKKIAFKMRPEFSLKFYGNIRNLIPELTNEKYTNNSLPILLRNESLPDFNTCLIFSDLIF